MLTEDEKATVRGEDAAAAAPAKSSGAGERASRAYVAVTLHMLGGGKARTGSCILMRGAENLLPPAKPGLAGRELTAGRPLESEVGTGRGTSTAVCRPPAAGYACVACVPGQSYSSAGAGSLVRAQPDTNQKAGLLVGGNYHTACSNKLDSSAADAAGQQPSTRTATCPILGPGCLLGFVTCGWQAGMSGACPVQGAVAVQSFSGAAGASQADVWVGDYRSGLLHAAVAQPLFL